MTSSSNRSSSPKPAASDIPGNTSQASNSAHLYTRFIPREELGSFSAWHPEAFQNEAEVSTTERKTTSVRAHPAGPSQASVPETPEQVAKAKAQAEALAAARQAGYDAGYQDGLAALENFKQSFAMQVVTQNALQFEAIAVAYQARLESLEQQLSGRLAGVALELARQVVRAEISQKPELIVQVAEEALAALLTSARHISIRLHAEDQAILSHALKENLQTRGIKLVIDPSLTRGGCVVESDIAMVDARVESRWRRVAALLGSQMNWQPPAAGPALALDEPI